MAEQSLIPVALTIGDGYLLTRINRGDKTAYLEHFTDPEIARNTLAIPYPYTDADADWWLDYCAAHACDPEVRFAIREPSGYLIGAIGINGALGHPSAAASSTAEFGYWLAKAFRGRGIMTRAIRAFTEHVFLRVGLHRLFATPFGTNIASQRVLEKAGFQREGVLREHYRKEGVYLDAVVYGCLSHEIGQLASQDAV